MNHTYLVTNKNNDFRIFNEKPQWSNNLECWITNSKPIQYGLKINSNNLAQYLQDLAETDIPIRIDTEFKL